MIVRLKRHYEVSIWTLQDSFITVLKWFNLENKGQIQNPKMSLNTDGTQDFSFTIPMYINEGAERKENPIWYNAINGNLAINMRKIKVIFNKKKINERVFEFLITKVTEKHENGELMCEVSCEGLAFHELGKVGYKISLQQEDFENDYAEWAESNNDEEEPIANIQYWLNKFLTARPEGNLIKNKWYYEISMDWSSFSYADQRDSSKIYEEEYVSSWSLYNNELVPGAVEAFREKARMVDLTESNIYNLTQELAEKFGVFCRYDYLYDDTYHIIGRVIVFYNNFIAEQNGVIDITYPYDTSTITREMDGTELTTKLFIKSVDSENSPSGQISIIDVEANKTREDYLLNFDYMYLKGIISEEQYQGIKEFENNIAIINNLIIPLADEIINLSSQLPELYADRTILENAIPLDQEQEKSADDLLNALTDGTSIITRDNTNPVQGVLFSENNLYSIRIRELGVMKGSIKIYKTYDTRNNILSNEIALDTATFVCDEAGNLEKIININSNSGGVVYLTFSYRPATQYDNIKILWGKKKLQDESNLNNLNEQITNIENKLEEAKELYDNKLLEKQQLIKEFEEMMGPALREGYWQADDYTNNYEEKHSVIFTSSNINTGASGNQVDFIWDTIPLKEEQLGYYTYSILEEQINYPYLILSSKFFSNGHSISDFFNQGLSLIFNRNGTTINFSNPLNVTDLGELNTFVDILALKSGCQLAFKMINNVATPILLLTGLETIELGQNAFATNSFILGTTTLNANNKIVINNSWSCTASDIEKNSDGILVYPRIKIKSAKMKNDPSSLFLSYNNILLDTAKDYISLFNIHNDNENLAYFITLQPDALLSNGYNGSYKTLNIKYALSTEDIAIYLDAQQVLKENAFPKVSYTVTPNIFNEELVETLYNKLNTIVHINDVDLKFENVLGYISKVDLDLDQPDNDSIEIKNYKTKFEDLFSTIVAQTEQMKKNEATISAAAKAFSASGTIAPDVIKDSLYRVDLDYAFNNGSLTIDNENGIWATSDSGVVAMRGGGIFTATEQDANGKWLWNTGIVPSGINADLITTGQLDTNLIKIFSGDRIRFQWNGDGLFAYKDNIQVNASTLDANVDKNNYVKLCEDGLFLHKYATTIDENQNEVIAINTDRVSISWDGLILKNDEGTEVFYADPNTGNLILTGTITAAAGNIGGWQINTNQLNSGSTNTYVALNSDSTNNYAIWAGATEAEVTTNNTTTYAPFSVTKTGQLRATNAIIGGTIVATSFTLNGNTLDSIIEAKGTAEGWGQNGLDTLTWQNNTYVALTSTAGLLLGMNSSNGSRFVIPRASNSSDTYVDISKNGIYFNYYNSNNVLTNQISMDQNGIKMTDPAGRLQPIWSQDNIVVMNNYNSNNPDWNQKQEWIEYAMRNKLNWVLIKPFYDATIAYIPATTETSEVGRKVYSLIQNDNGQKEFGITSSYRYRLTFKAKGTWTDISQQGNMSMTITLRDITNGTTFILYNNVNSPIKSYYQWTEYDTGVLESSINFCKGTNILKLDIEYNTAYWYSGFNWAVDFDEVVLTCTQDATTSRVPCTTYYYPNIQSSLSRPTGYRSNWPNY